MHAQIFNRAAFDELRMLETEGSPGLINDLIADFNASGHELAVGIIGSARASDVKLLERHAHSLKSSSRALGMDRLSDLAAEIETAARGGQIAEAAVSSLPETLAAALAALNAFGASAA